MTEHTTNKMAETANLNLIEIKQLTYRYSDGTEALCGIDLGIRQGEKLAVIGPNGSGKSTLFLCLNGVLKAKTGSISWQGKPLEYDKKSLLETRKNVGIVFQDPETQLFCINVYQEIAFGPSNLGLQKAELQACVEQNLERMNIAHLREKPPHFLSGGQKKQVSIASVVAMNPKLIIFDEPTNALDQVNAQSTIDLMNELHAQGITVVMSTHDMELAYQWSDRVVVLQDGKVLRADEPTTVFADKKLLQQANLAQPKVLQFFLQLQKHGLLADDLQPPKTMAEVEAYLAAANH